MRADPRDPHEAMVKAIVNARRSADVQAFGRWARTRDTAPRRTRVPGRQQPMTLGEHVVRFLARCDFDTRLSVVAVICLLAALAYGARGWASL